MKRDFTVRHDPELRLETNSVFRKALNTLLIPFLNVLPVKSRGVLKKTNRAVEEIVNNATNHTALEILYKKGNIFGKKNLYELLSHWIWFNTNNSKAVRNRIKIVKKEIGIALSLITENKKNIKMLSIASGSARAVIEAIHEFDMKSKVHIETTFLDKNPLALTYSKELLEEIGLNKESTHYYNWINGTAGTFLRNCSENYDIIEMVGLMDYFSDDKAVEIFGEIYEKLSKNGIFVTANINENFEKPFITKAIGWPMIYRSVSELSALIQKAGFSEEKLSLYYEPHKIHGIVVAIK